MSSSPVQVETPEDLNRNLSLLSVGANVIIEINTPTGKKGKFRTCFIGFLPKNYILIQYPEASKLGSFSQYVKPGSTITVRGLIEMGEGAVVAFVTTVRQTLQTPSRLLVLEFPYKVSLQKLRSNIRIETRLAVKVGIGKEYFAAHISDISVAGSQIIVHNALSLMMANDKDIAVIIENFKGESNLKLNGMIRNIKKQANDVSLGVLFSEDIKDPLLQVIEHILTGETNN